VLLETRDLTVFYGGVAALQAFSFSVEPGTLVAVIGSNGAGKTTLLRSIMGEVPVRSGRVIYSSKDVTGQRPYRIVRQGMTIVPQDRGTLSPLTVLENLQLAGQSLKSNQHSDRELDEIFEMFPQLFERRGVRAGLLSGGEQQMLSIGRALMTKPQLLLLDEPSTGLSPLMAKAIMSIAEDLRDKGMTLVIVEQNVAAVLSIADFAYVLEQGRLVQSGIATEVLADPTIRAAFLGA
jgi:branched-chain amino acid transport system ATP-binding protein